MVLQAEAGRPGRGRGADGRDDVPRLGEDALSLPAPSTSRWNAADYASVGAFVARLGGAALDLLDPQPGERILDVGCGDGALTYRIATRGAEVVGVDISDDLLAVARATGLDVRRADAAEMDFAAEFDAAFSNAALHWMLDRDRVASAIFRALRLGGRFAGEMGGEGNLGTLRSLLDEELVARGYIPPTGSTNWYPSVEEFADTYEKAGFCAIDARLIERPTEIPEGIAAWVTTFRSGWLEQAGVPSAEYDEIAQAVADKHGSDTADYVRLRFFMRKPD